MQNIKSFIITGPTASGKSGFAHKLAKSVNGVIINCDSVQIYRGIENISASPFAGCKVTDDLDGIPYRLFSILDLSEQISVVDYLKLAKHEYYSAIDTGRIPIFVGGTGYYINALINGISPIPDIDSDIRNRARQMVTTDIASVRNLLQPDFKATDPQRVARALEVFLQTGKHLTFWQNLPREGAVISDAFKIVINPSVEDLKKRIADRIPMMLSGGALDEAKRILCSNWNPDRAIGARQLVDFLQGRISQTECINNWIIKTNQYAKRQRTWFRTQFQSDYEITHVPNDDDINSLLL